MRALFICYLVLLHLGMLIWLTIAIRDPRWLEFGLRANLRAQLYNTRVAHQARRASQMQGGVAFIGDSVVEDMATSAIAPCAENFGIGGDTIGQVAGRLARIDLSRAGAVVLHVGINEWPASRFDGFASRYAEMLSRIPVHVPVIASAMLPVDEARSPAFRGALARLAGANGEMRATCAQRAGCSFVDAGTGLADPNGALAADLTVGDGVHLNAAGYRFMGARLRSAIASVATSPGIECASSASPAAQPKG